MRRTVGDEQDAEILRRVRDYYDARYRAHGDSAQGMDWADQASQRLRFERLLRHLDLAGNPSLLDVGCGNGELLTYAREQGVAIRYQGIDVSQEMVEACRRRHGEEAAFAATPADLQGLGRTFDYVVASGPFNVRQEIDKAVWGGHVRRAVKQMFAACRRAAVFNVMSTRVDYRYDRLYYMDAADLPALADSCGTRRFVIDHGYPLFEMTMALYRE